LVVVASSLISFDWVLIALFFALLKGWCPSHIVGDTISPKLITLRVLSSALLQEVLHYALVPGILLLER